MEPGFAETSEQAAHNLEEAASAIYDRARRLRHLEQHSEALDMRWISGDEEARQFLVEMAQAENHKQAEWELWEAQASLTCKLGPRSGRKRRLSPLCSTQSHPVQPTPTQS